MNPIDRVMGVLLDRSATVEPRGAPEGTPIDSARLPLSDLLLKGRKALLVAGAALAIGGFMAHTAYVGVETVKALSDGMPSQSQMMHDYTGNLNKMANTVDFLRGQPDAAKSFFDLYQRNVEATAQATAAKLQVVRASLGGGPQSGPGVR